MTTGLGVVILVVWRWEKRISESGQEVRGI